MAKIPIEKWFGWIQDQIQSRSIVDSADIKASRGKTGTQLFLQKNSGGGEEGSSATATATSYDGPFAVTEKTGEANPTVTINASTGVSGDNWANQAQLGVDRVYLISTQDYVLPDTVSRYIYLEFVRSGSAFIDSIKSSTSYPAQSDTEWVFPLAYVAMDAGVITKITQMQYGQINVDGRIV